MAIKTIPNDIVAEQSVLGAMFLSPLAIEKQPINYLLNPFI